MEMVKEKEQKAKVDMQEMMKVYKELGTPGPQHKLLAKMAGNWKTKVRSWYEPGKPAKETAGTSEQKMIFDGRYLLGNETGDMMGIPFKGMGITGFDNSSKKFVSFWVDSMSTGIFYFEGGASQEENTITMENRYNDPVRGPMKYRSLITIVNDNTYTFEMFATDKSGVESRSMEITYTRAK